jgi:beta-mannanase
VRAELPDQTSATAKARVAENVASRPGIEYAEPNAIYEALVVPNDPRFGDQYAPEMVNTPVAWDTTLGDSDVTIAVVDQGIKYDHPDLEGNMVNGNGRDFVDDDSTPIPDVLADEYHGTHVAGIAAAGTDDNVGIAGISNASLLSVRALDETGTGYTSDIADGIQWAADNGADVINLSLGGGGYTETLQNAVAYAQGKGVLLVTAAGNDYGGSVSYPAAYSECMAISALDSDGSLASYSNTGPKVELAAPGTNLLSTWTDDGYNSISGTSMATPIVSGVAALVLSHRTLSNQEVRKHLTDTSIDIGLSSEEQGAGKVNAGAITESTGKILTIEATGQRADYQFTVESDLAKSTANGADLNSADTISGQTATGYVTSGLDSYTFSGQLQKFDLNGNADVLLNGELWNSDSSPTIGIYSGLSDADFSTVGRMEEWQNAPYPVQNLFVPWNPDDGHMNWLFDRILPRIWNAGRVPLITWEPYTPSTQTASVDTAALVERNEYDAYIESLADTTSDDIEIRIADGEYDQYVDRWANRLQEFLAASADRRVYVRLAHEMNGDWYPWSPTVGDSSAQSYIRMWRHVYDRFEQQGLTGDATDWIWCVNAEDVGSHTAEQLYPGGSYVDWFGVDGYNWGQSQSWSAWESPDSVYGGMLDRLRDLADKPVCVAEFASSSMTKSGHDPQRKDEWIRNALSYFDDRGVDMWCWFNKDKETDWAVFDGARGTETVTYDGEQVDAYRAYRKTVSSDTTATTDTIASKSSTGDPLVGDD